MYQFQRLQARLAMLFYINIYRVNGAIQFENFREFEDCMIKYQSAHGGCLGNQRR